MSDSFLKKNYMNKIRNALRHRIYPFIRRRNRYFVTKCFLLGQKNHKYNEKLTLLYNHNQICSSLEIRDKRWSQIKNIDDIMKNDMYCKVPFLSKRLLFSSNDNFENDKVIFENKEIKCKSSNTLNDWIFIKNHCEIKEPYVFEFEAKILNENSEFQFAFFYKNIGNRYRFNLKKNKVLSFEVIESGCFHNDILSKPFSLPIGEWVKLKITITNNMYIYNVNHEDLLVVKNKHSKKIDETTNFALILWDSNLSNINTSYRNLNISYIQ